METIATDYEVLSPNLAGGDNQQLKNWKQDDNRFYGLCFVRRDKQICTIIVQLFYIEQRFQNFLRHLPPFKSDFANISLQKAEKRGIFNVNLKVNKIFK